MSERTAEEKLHRDLQDEIGHLTHQATTEELQTILTLLRALLADRPRENKETRT